MLNRTGISYCFYSSCSQVWSSGPWWPLESFRVLQDQNYFHDNFAFFTVTHALMVQKQRSVKLLVP